MGDAPINWLMFFTLAAGIVVAGGAFLAFLRSQRNRDITANAHLGDGKSRGVEPSGALAEQLGMLVLAIVAMGLLALGYQSH